MAMKQIDKETMGRRIKELRISAGKSVEEMSNDTGIGQAALRNYECGLRIPRYTAMFTIASYFGTTVDSLFF